jgi:hypothetical protein
MRVVLNVVLGLAIPIVWGLASAWAFEWLRDRRRRSGGERR